MRFETIKSFVDSRLQRGLSQQDVRDLVKLVAGGDGKLNKTEAKQLAKVALLYADQFTSAGARTFTELTGMDLKPVQALPRERRTTALDLRARLAREARSDEIFRGRAAGGYGRSTSASSYGGGSTSARRGRTSSAGRYGGETAPVRRDRTPSATSYGGTSTRRAGRY